MDAAFITMNFLLVRITQIKWILLIDIVIYLAIHIWLGYKLKITEKQNNLLNSDEKIGKLENWKKKKENEVK
jgi:hypothetical protein